MFGLKMEPCHEVVRLRDRLDGWIDNVLEEVILYRPRKNMHGYQA
jgi:hypothetical protein